MARKNSETEGALADEIKAGEAQTLPDGEELVDYTAPLAPWMTSRDVFAAVNGETIRIKRGTPVKIKRKFLEILQNAAEQEMKAYEYRTAAQKESAKAVAALF